MDVRPSKGITKVIFENSYWGSTNRWVFWRDFIDSKKKFCSKNEAFEQKKATKKVAFKNIIKTHFIPHYI